MTVIAPPAVNLIALALCQARDCDRECFLDPAACHIWAAAHQAVTGHPVLVIETTTTSYQAAP